MKNNKGGHFTPHTEYSKKLMSIAHQGKLLNEENPLWMGDKVGYNALHAWISRKLGKPDTCELCGKSGLIGHQIQWASKSRKYKRDLDNWIRLCALCHYKYDNLSAKRWFGHIKNSKRTCLEIDCWNIVKASSLCGRHYLKKWRALNV